MDSGNYLKLNLAVFLSQYNTLWHIFYKPYVAIYCLMCNLCGYNQYKQNSHESKIIYLLNLIYVRKLVWEVGLKII